MPLPSFPNTDPERLSRIRQVFDEAGYNAETLRSIFSGSSNANISHPVSLKKWEYLTRDGNPLTVFIRLFGLHLTEPIADVEPILAPTSLDDWISAGLLMREGDGVRAQVQLYPFMDRLIAGDIPQNQKHSQSVLALSSPAAALAELLIRKPMDSVCDLGTGCGVLALLAAENSERVVAVDLNPRALELTRLNAGLNGAANIETRQGDWFEPIRDDRFDLVVCNPPFLISPESELMFRDGTGGDTVAERLIRSVPNHLNDGGYAQIICNWAHREDIDGESRMASWANGTGCDVWVLTYGANDPASYAEEWIRETADGDTAKFEKWMEYYRQQEITAISSGVVLMRKRDGETWFQHEKMPERICPCGDAVVQGFVQRDIAQLDDEALLKTELVLSPDAIMEQDLVQGTQGWMIANTFLSLKLGFAGKAAIDMNTRRLATQFMERQTLRNAFQSIAKQFNAEVDQVTAGAMPIAREMIVNGILIGAHRRQ